MTFWIDAQMGPRFARWLAEAFGVDARPLEALGLRDADDRTIFDAARRAGDVVVITKDEDFLELVTLHGPPPRIIWLTCGNTSNAELAALFAATSAEARRRLADGEAVVEIA